MTTSAGCHYKSANDTSVFYTHNSSDTRLGLLARLEWQACRSGFFLESRESGFTQIARPLMLSQNSRPQPRSLTTISVFRTKLRRCFSGREPCT
jgi:hypothetical protein